MKSFDEPRFPLLRVFEPNRRCEMFLRLIRLILPTNSNQQARKPQQKSHVSTFRALLLELDGLKIYFSVFLASASERCCMMKQLSVHFPSGKARTPKVVTADGFIRSLNLAPAN